MKKYSKKEQTIIKEMKEYLKAIRTLKRERQHLLEEYDEQPTPHSPSLQEVRGQSISQNHRFNNYTARRDLLLKKIELFDHEIDYFLLHLFYLTTRQRYVVETYLNAMSYMELMDMIEEEMSMSTYKRELPEICLLLSHYIDYENIPTVESINQEFYKLMKKEE